MSKKNTHHEESGFENIEQALSRTEQYIEENKKSLGIILLVIAIVVGGYFLYTEAYMKPKEVEAQTQMYRAEQYFEVDSFALALEGDGDAYGFVEIIDEYGMTASANLAHYYAGICYLYLGEYESAVEYLTQFDSNDKLVSVVALGAIGDAYVELDQPDKAVSFFEKAANKNPNDLMSAIYLKKAGLAYEALENYKKAVSAYEKIESDYPGSEEAKDISKRIAKAKMKI